MEMKIGFIKHANKTKCVHKARLLIGNEAVFRNRFAKQAKALGIKIVEKTRRTLR
jgi:hypothetical protein